LVFVGSHDNNFYALNKESGNIAWFFTCKAAIHSNPVVNGENVFFGCDDGRFYSLNKTSGLSTWFFAPGLTINDDIYNYLTTPIISSSVVDNGVVYIGAKGNIYALNV
jgi:outer membrane protein assembly factor BamB